MTQSILRLAVSFALLGAIVPSVSHAAKRTEVFNPAPRTASDSYSVSTDEILSVGAPGVLANDSDSSGTSLASTIVEPPLHGTVALNLDGSFVFVPFPGYEGADAFTYAASNGTFASNAVVSITVRNDRPAPAIYIADVRMDEGNAGVTPFGFAVTLSSPSTRVITVNYRVGPLSASAYEDFIPSSGVITFAPGTTTSYVFVAVNGDTKFEGGEYFYVQLFTPVNATIADSIGLGLIVNDDTP